jgi:hypothetical protein
VLIVLSDMGIADDHELARANQEIDLIKAIMPCLASTSQHRGGGAWHSFEFPKTALTKCDAGGFAPAWPSGS